MAVRDKLRTNAAHLLQPGETIQAVFCAQTIYPYAVLVSIWALIIADAYRAIIVTDRRIVVCRTGRFMMSAVKGIETELPRSTRIGNPTGLWWTCTTLGRKLWVHRRFHKDVKEADAALHTV